LTSETGQTIQKSNLDIQELLDYLEKLRKVGISLLLHMLHVEWVSSNLICLRGT